MKRSYYLSIFLIVQIIILKILRFFPEFVEQHYSNGFYVYVSKIFRIGLGVIPFSVGDCLYFVLIVVAVRWLWKKRKSWKQKWKDNLLDVLAVLSLFYFFFHMLWALNYYRVPLFDKMQIERDYTDADLLAFTKKLINKTNAIQNQLTKNDSSKVVFPYSQKKVFDLNQNGYDNLSKEYGFFTYSHLCIKKSLFSLPLTYMGFGGYLNPFTNEAQLNYLGPMYSFPMTANHEMAHQMGYASESECNFIGFLASIKNDNLYVQYSGYSMALRYCLANWQLRDEKILDQLLKTINPGILKNYKESQDFWKAYETPIETAFHLFYDRFLKINQQKDGMDSYSKYVNLMVNYFKDKPL